MSQYNRGFLFSAFLIIASPLCAQTTECQQGTCTTPSKVEDGGKVASDGQSDKGEFVIPFRLVQTPEDAQRADERENTASEHDAADLEAQQTAAAAAERGAAASEWQVWLGAAGAIGLLLSLIFTAAGLFYAARGNKNTIRAIDQEQANAKQAIRAYVIPGISSVKNVVLGGKPIFDINVQNTGQTPAKAFRMTFRVGFISEDPNTIKVMKLDKSIPSIGDVGSGRGSRITRELARPLSASDLDGIKSGNLKFFTCMIYCYRDLFGAKRRGVARMFTNAETAVGTDGTEHSLAIARRNNRSS